MTSTMTHSLTRFGRRVAAFVTECNYAQNRLSNLQDTPTRF